MWVRMKQDCIVDNYRGETVKFEEGVEYRIIDKAAVEMVRRGLAEKLHRVNKPMNGSSGPMLYGPDDKPLIN